MFDRDREGARAAWVALAASVKERADRETPSFLQRTTVDGELVFHSLRHAYATALVANLDLKSAQILTRHATVAILGDQYARGRRDKAAAGVEKAIANPVRASDQSNPEPKTPAG